MDLTDKNNEKFTKLIEILGRNYQVTFYYNYRTKEFKYWGISRSGFSPSSPWDEIIEQYITEHHEYELRELAKYEVQMRAGKGGTFDGEVSSETVYPEKYRRG